MTYDWSVVASVLSLLGALWPGAQAPADADTVLQKLGGQTRVLRDSLGDQEQLARIDAHIAVLDKARIAGLGGRIGAEYHDSLLADLALLERATAMLRQGERSKAIAAVTDAEADLGIKRRHVEAGTGFSGSGLRTVNVTVRTVRGGAEEPGHTVWFVARGWSDVPDRFERFEGLSSPTTTVLPPGNYFMWAGGASDQARHPIAIGGHGRSRQTVDLPLR